MKMAKVVEHLIKEKGTLKDFALANDIPPTTLYTVLKRGCSNSSVSVVLKICKGLGLTFAELYDLSETGDYTSDEVFFLDPDSKSISELLAQRPEYGCLFKATNKLSKDDILNLAKAIDNANSDDINLISNILDRMNNQK